MVNPITPEQAIKQKDASIPDFVIEEFNKQIIENLSVGRRIVTSTFRQEDVEKAIRERCEAGQFKYRWLDVEDMYRNCGWKVEYDKPGYNESYPATFTFSRGS